MLWVSFPRKQTLRSDLHAGGLLGMLPGTVPGRQGGESDWRARGWRTIMQLQQTSADPSGGASNCLKLQQGSQTFALSHSTVLRWSFPPQRAITLDQRAPCLWRDSAVSYQQSTLPAARRTKALVSQGFGTAYHSVYYAMLRSWDFILRMRSLVCFRQGIGMIWCLLLREHSSWVMKWWWARMAAGRPIRKQLETARMATQWEWMVENSGTWCMAG